MNRKKIFTILILFAVLITCSSVSFASSDFDDSYIDDSDYDLDDDLSDGLDDEDLNDESDDYLDDDLEDDLDDDSEDDWDDEDLDDDSEDDWGDEDFNDDSEDDFDDDDLDDDSEDDFDDDDFDDKDWNAIDWDEDWDYKYDLDDWYDDMEWEEYNTTGNLTILLLKKTIYRNYISMFKNTAGFAVSEDLIAYKSNTSDDDDCDSEKHSYSFDYAENSPATSLDSNYDGDKDVPAIYNTFVAKSIDLGNIEDSKVSELQLNRTDDSNNITDVNVAKTFEYGNFLAIIAMIVLCLITIL